MGGWAARVGGESSSEVKPQRFSLLTPNILTWTLPGRPARPKSGRFGKQEVDMVVVVVVDECLGC